MIRIISHIVIFFLDYLKPCHQHQRNNFLSLTNPPLRIHQLQILGNSVYLSSDDKCLCSIDTQAIIHNREVTSHEYVASTYKQSRICEIFYYSRELIYDSEHVTVLFEIQIPRHETKGDLHAIAKIRVSPSGRRTQMLDESTQRFREYVPLVFVWQLDGRDSALAALEQWILHKYS